MSNEIKLYTKKSIKNGKDLLTVTGGKISDGVYKYTSGGIFTVEIEKESCELMVFMTVSSVSHETEPQFKKVYIEGVTPREFESLIVSKSTELSCMYETILLKKINENSPVVFE